MPAKPMSTPYRLAIAGHLAMVAAALLAAFGSVSVASGAHAASLRGFYEARLAAPLASAATPVLSGVAWNCAGDACSAPKAGSRPAVVCARLARKVGPLSSFAVEGEALDPQSLARCNGGD